MKICPLFLTLLPITSCIVCRSDYTLINGKTCLKYYSTPVTHTVAEQNCKLDGGLLATAKNAIDNRALASLANSAGASEIWLGLACFGNTSDVCYWDDTRGTAQAYSNFMPGSQSENVGYCVEMLTGSSFGVNQGKWKSVPCNAQNFPTIRSFPYVCEVPPTTSFSPCDVNYNGYCYWRSKNLTGGKLNFKQAADVCAQRGAGTKLVSIHSKMEVDLIKTIHRGSVTNFIYIGAQHRFGDTYAWIDGSEWDFNYVHPLDLQTQKCLVMDVSSGGAGLWLKRDCSEQYEFLCKQKIPSTVPENLVPESTPPIILDSTNCNSTFVMAPGQISSYPALGAPTTYCSWRVLALGPYKVGIYFDYWSTYGELDFYNEYGVLMGKIPGGLDRPTLSFETYTNVGFITFTPKIPSGPEVDKGFHAVLLPV